jgi:hypothetical protein
MKHVYLCPVWQTKYGKSYSETHDAQRKKLFLAKDATIAKHNSQTKATFLMEHNQFSDMVVQNSNEIIRYTHVHKPHELASTDDHRIPEISRISDAG